MPFNTGVFSYSRTDVAADAAPAGMLWNQINDFKSKRGNFKEFKAIQKSEHDDKTITSIVYQGDKDLLRYCYRFSLIEFKADDSKFAVVIQVTLPEKWNQSEPVLSEITNTARAVPLKN